MILFKKFDVDRERLKLLQHIDNLKEEIKRVYTADQDFLDEARKIVENYSSDLFNKDFVKMMYKNTDNCASKYRKGRR